MSNQNLDQQLLALKRKLESFMIQFNEILQDKVLPDNKSQAALNKETDIVQQLLMTANELDQINQMEGMYGLITLCLREGLLFRDMFNHLKYKISLVERENEKLKKSFRRGPEHEGE